MAHMAYANGDIWAAVSEWDELWAEQDACDWMDNSAEMAELEDFLTRNGLHKAWFAHDEGDLYESWMPTDIQAEAEEAENTDEKEEKMEFTNIQVAKAFFATATDEQLREFIDRNGLGETLTFNSCNVWCRGAEFGTANGFTRCDKINTKKNRIRGNWYINRI